ncbi:MAG: DUF5106 domain-containing protein [Taibaiella sp.]|nr:DUF5106 domain-containing protein [Taibaiella sp.]
MKRISLFALLMVGMAQLIFARDGYRIQIKIDEVQEGVVYLAHYYGKPLPSAIYKADSATFDKNGVAVIESKQPLVGGIYIIMLSDHKTYFELLLNNGDNMSISTSIKNLPDGIVFKNSPDNEQFMGYVRFLKNFGTKQKELVDRYAAARTNTDTSDIRKKLKENSLALTTYRRNYASAHPNTLLANIFNALELPEVPEGKHLLPDGTVDSNFTYEYYKAHYWDHFNFRDDRLVYTPIYDAKLDEYFNKLVLPYPDSIEVEGDKLLAKTRGTKELFKYTLWWLEHNAQDSKIMGMDAVVVYLVENYYMKGDATWLSNEDLNKYIDYASKIAPNVLGNLAPEIKMPDVNGKEQSLMAVKAKYTLLLFWSPDCSHCQKEIPLVDSVYRAVLKAKGTKVYAVRTEGDDTKWKEMIKKMGITDWINVSDPDHTRQDYRRKYDVYSTPIMYLLDENKIIRGKKIDHTNIADVIELLERKERSKTKK